METISIGYQPQNSLKMASHFFTITLELGTNIARMNLQLAALSHPKPEKDLMGHQWLCEYSVRHSQPLRTQIIGKAVYYFSV